MHRLVSNDHYFHGGPPNYNVIKHFDLLTVTTIHSPNLTFVPSLSEISFFSTITSCLVFSWIHS